MACRYCLDEEGEFISPCRCKGSVGLVHESCFNKWLATIQDKTEIKCPICKSHIPTTTNFERPIFGHNNALKINAYYLYVLMHTFVGILLVYDCTHIPPVYVQLQIATFIGHYSYILYGLYNLKNKKVFTQYFLGQEPYNVVICLIPPFIIANIALVDNLPIISYLWLTCISQLLYPYTINNINSTIELVNRYIEQNIPIRYQSA